MNTIYLVEASRTPIGSFLGSLSSQSASQLGASAIKGLLAKLPALEINQVILGSVLTAGQGQAPARQAMRYAGLPDSVGALTINKVCASGLKAVWLAAHEILAGEANAVIAGGMEAMSQTPHYLTTLRNGQKMGNANLIDGMIHDGLWDPYSNFHMGNAGELCAQKYQFSREAQDAYATQSFERAIAAVNGKQFEREISPVSIPQRKGDPVIVSSDEQPFKNDYQKIGKLPPAFQKDGGTITAGNASTINDGAAAILVCSEEYVKQHQLKPMAKLVAAATHSQEPEWFTTAPVGAIQKVLQKAQLSLNDIDLFEVNEAFAVVAMAAQQELQIPSEKLNVRGGAIALGHPIGASGARLLVSLMHSLQDLGKQRGVVSICNGGGEAVAMLIERV